MGIVEQADFYLDGHRKIFAAILTLFEMGNPVDMVLLTNFLQECGQLEDVGSYAYLAELWEASPTGANLEHHAQPRPPSAGRGIESLVADRTELAFGEQQTNSVL